MKTPSSITEKKSKHEEQNGEALPQGQSQLLQLEQLILFFHSKTLVVDIYD
jgi:hypothetical protein